jgi:hypothetical protein
VGRKNKGTKAKSSTTHSVSRIYICVKQILLKTQTIRRIIKYSKQKFIHPALPVFNVLNHMMKKNLM